MEGGEEELSRWPKLHQMTSITLSNSTSYCFDATIESSCVGTLHRLNWNTRLDMVGHRKPTTCVVGRHSLSFLSYVHNFKI